MPEISIIVPVYCAEAYLEKCINHILAQTFVDFELLLIDDGSPDSSGAICDKYAKCDSRVRAIHKNNGGVSSARNAGIKNACGKYVMFCDSDDFVDPRWCIELYSVMEKHNVDMGICGYAYVDSDGIRLKGNNVFSDEHRLVLPTTSVWDIYYKCFLNMPWNKIYRRSIINDNSISFNEKIQYNEDLLFVLDYLAVSNLSFGMVNMPLYFYRQDIAGSLTKRYLPDLWNIKLEVFRRLDEVIKKSGIEIDAISQEYYSKWCWSIVESASYVLHKQNKASELKKYLKLIDIFHSKECKEAFSLGKIENTSTVYRWVLKTRCALLVYCYVRASSIKQ